MAVFSRIRLQADQFRLSTTPTAAGDVVFEQGTFDGISRLILKKALIRDLSVKTINLKHESVNVPAYSELVSDFTVTSTGDTNDWETVFEHELVTKGAPGSTIYLLFLWQVGFTSVSMSGSMFVRVLINGVQLLPQFFPGNSASGDGRQRAIMGTVPATGAVQTLNIRWEALPTGLSGAQSELDAGSRTMTVAMKR
jgi:hypothetical protein